MRQVFPSTCKLSSIRVCDVSHREPTQSYLGSMECAPRPDSVGFGDKRPVSFSVARFHEDEGLVRPCLLVRPNVQGQGRCAALSRSVPCTAGLGISFKPVRLSASDQQGALQAERVHLQAALLLRNRRLGWRLSSFQLGNELDCPRSVQ